MAKARILFVLPTLGGGGAQRVMMTLLNHLPSDTFERHLAVVEKTGPLIREVPRDVEFHNLNTKRVRRSFGPLLRLIRHVKPDVVFSTMTRLNLALSMLKPLMPRGTRLVVREVTFSDAMLGSFPWRGLKRRMLRKHLPKADRIVCLSEFMRQDLHDSFQLPIEKMATIYNPIDFEYLRSQALADCPFPEGCRSPNILAVGRLKQPTKGFDRLIDAVPSLLENEPNAQLWLLGEGPSEQKLRRQAAKLNVESIVHFCGFQENPYRWLAHADLFVLPSRHEGTPNVLLEAMACDCPILALEHPGGTREIMELTEQQDRIVPQLDEWDPEWFRRPDSSVAQRLESVFGVERIVDQYVSVLLGEAPATLRKAESMRRAA